MAGEIYSRTLPLTVLIVSLAVMGTFGLLMQHEIGSLTERCEMFFILAATVAFPIFLLNQNLETVRNSSLMRGPHGPFLQTLNVFVGAVVTCLLNSIHKPDLILFISGLVALVCLNELARPTIDFGLINSVFSSTTGHFGLFTHTLPSILGSLVCCCMLYIRFHRQAAWPKVSVDSTQQQQQQRELSLDEICKAVLMSPEMQSLQHQLRENRDNVEEQMISSNPMEKYRQERERLLEQIEKIKNIQEATSVVQLLTGTILNAASYLSATRHFDELADKNGADFRLGESSQSTGPSQHPTAGEEVDELTTAADFPATGSSNVNVQQLISKFNRKFDRP